MYRLVNLCETMLSAVNTSAGLVSLGRAAHVVDIPGASMYTADSIFICNTKVELCPEPAEQPNDTQVCSLYKSAAGTNILQCRKAML